jgi:hydrogenase maturation protease
MESTSPGAVIDLLVIGYGNTLRGDDSVGPRVAEAIEALILPGVRALSCNLLTPELAETISQARRVVFVDASVEPAAEVEMKKLFAAESSQVFAHAANPRTLLAMARDLFGHVPEAWCLSIPVENLEIGEELSAMAKRGLDVAIKSIRELAR